MQKWYGMCLEYIWVECMADLRQLHFKVHLSG